MCSACVRVDMVDICQYKYQACCSYTYQVWCSYKYQAWCGVRMCALGAAQAFRVSRRAKQANWTATLYFCICVFVFLVFVMLCQTDKLDCTNTVFGEHILFMKG